MAENKKSFILYADQIHLFESLSDDEAGKVIKHLFRYVNDLNPELPDRTTQLIFEPIKQQLKRDLETWKKSISGKSEGGKKSAEMRKKLKEMQEELDKFKILQDTSTNSTVNVNDNVNVNVNVNDNVNESVSNSNSNNAPTQILGVNYRPKYEDTNEEFRKMYDKGFYDAWLSINSFLDENCKYLRNWDNQLTISEFKKMYDRILKKDFNISQARTALQELDGSRKAKDNYNSVYHGFNTFIKTILKGSYV